MHFTVYQQQCSVTQNWNNQGRI